MVQRTQMRSAEIYKEKISAHSFLVKAISAAPPSERVEACNKSQQASQIFRLPVGLV